MSARIDHTAKTVTFDDDDSEDAQHEAQRREDAQHDAALAETLRSLALPDAGQDDVPLEDIVASLKRLDPGSTVTADIAQNVHHHVTAQSL